LERAPNKALRNALVEPTTSMSIGSLRRFANMSGSAIRGRSARARKTASLNGRHLSQPSLRAERVKAAARESGVERSESLDTIEHRIRLSRAGR
jgi:hypothetical protein